MVLLGRQRQQGQLAYVSTVSDPHENRERAESFGSVADQYDRARPTYPPELVDFLTDGGRPDVLDVGCGTGIASRLFVARGCRVLGVEPDERMAEVARRRGVAVEVSHFENWRAEGRTFDLLISGQAWHWVNPVTGPAKAAELVRGGGRIGLFWNRGVHPPQLQAELDRVYREFEPDLMRGYADPGPDRWFEGDKQRTLGQLLGSEPWEDVQAVEFSHVIAYTTASWLDQLPTHSDHLLLRPDRRAQLLTAVGAAIDAFGGGFDMQYSAVVVTARRRS